MTMCHKKSHDQSVFLVGRDEFYSRTDFESRYALNLIIPICSSNEHLAETDTYEGIYLLNSFS